jgi:CHAT domain-containing protein/SIR2-like protein
VPIRTLRFSLKLAGAGYSVALAVDDGAAASAPFQFELNPNSRLNQAIESIRYSGASYDALRDIGGGLFRGLMNGPVLDLFRATRKTVDQEFAAAADCEIPQFAIRLDVPGPLRYLPWECLYDETRASFLLNDPRVSLIRDTLDVEPPAARLAGTPPIQMLAVIPQGSNLNVEKELHSLEVAVAKLGDAVVLSRLDGQVTPDRLGERMRERRWDVVHFIGHGDVVGDEARIRLNDDNPEASDNWINGEVFSTFFRPKPPRLVVLNCCYGGSNASQRTLSGLGPLLQSVGAPAVVAMQYEVADTVAIKFAEHFYGALLGGPNVGRIDCALAAARLTLYQNLKQDQSHSFITPVLYLLAGFEALVTMPAAPPVAVRIQPVPAVTPPLPDDLVQAFKDRLVIPVIGPDLLRVGAMRSSQPPPGPRELAETLAIQSNYPRMSDFKLPEEASDRWLLPAVCQHFEQGGPQRFKLLIAVQSIYKTFKPPAVLRQQIGTWNVPGIICTFFDGMIDDIMTNRQVRVLHGIDEKIAGHRGETLLVHVRGVYSDGDSLVLTEADQEMLFDRMTNLSPQLTELVRETVGRSLVFLGVSPRDPVVRRLTRALRGFGRNQGPMYFVGTEPGSDAAYWSGYNTKWLADVKLEDFITAMTAATAGI